MTPPECFSAYAAVLLPWLLSAVALETPVMSVEGGFTILWMGLGTFCAWLPYLLRGRAHPAAVAAAAAVSGLWFWLLLAEFTAGYRVYRFQETYQGHSETLFVVTGSAILLLMCGMLVVAVGPAYLRCSALSAAAGAALHSMAVMVLMFAAWWILPFGIFG
ncbi:putative membrane protein [Neisseria musculi]|uniref:Membrane protein n=1 Tax=Neisseria musculi TaxID=1815583 RepID=A0A7H1MF49_9NEIS|nr:putative membrane protein [Neisseria musculi]